MRFFGMMLFLGALLLFNAILLASAEVTFTAFDEIVLVEIEDTSITYQDLLHRIDLFPNVSRSRYLTIDGQKQVLETLITEQLLVKNALDLGVDMRDDVVHQVHRGVRPVVNNIYFGELFAAATTPNDQDIANFYHDNIHSFKVPRSVTIQHLQVNPQDIITVSSLLESGVDFQRLIIDFSRNPVTSMQNGIISNIRADGFISGIGYDSLLERHISDAVTEKSVIRGISSDINIEDDNEIYGPFETITGIHFFRIVGYEPEVTAAFDEVKADIQAWLLKQTEREFYRSLMSELWARFDVKIDETILDRVLITIPFDGSTEFVMLPQMRDHVIVSGEHAEIAMTLGDLAELLRNPETPEGMSFNERNIREFVLRSEIDARVLYAAAQEASILEQNQDDIQMQHTKFGIIVNNWLQTHLIDPIHISEEELLEFYENNIVDFIIPASRDIRQFVSFDKRTAQTHRRVIARMLRREQYEDIINIIKAESLSPAFAGMITGVKNDGIIPGLGIDETDAIYNAKVWGTKIGVVSDVFQNKFGEYVFFYVFSENAERVRSFASVQDSIYDTVRRQKINENVDNIKTELLAQYGVITHSERLISFLTAEEMFVCALDAVMQTNYQQSIYFLQQIVDEYPNTEYAYDALFMKAYITVESMEDRSISTAMFAELLEKYSSGDLNDAARFLLEEL